MKSAQQKRQSDYNFVKNKLAQNGRILFIENVIFTPQNNT